MRSIWILFRREMRSYFVSPVAYTILVAFLVLSGWYFRNLLIAFVIYVITKALIKETPAAPSKKCPRCTETIAVEATKCKYCTADIGA